MSDKMSDWFSRTTINELMDGFHGYPRADFEDVFAEIMRPVSRRELSGAMSFYEDVSEKIDQDLMRGIGNERDLERFYGEVEMMLELIYHKWQDWD